MASGDRLSYGGWEPLPGVTLQSEDLVAEVMPAERSLQHALRWPSFAVASQFFPTFTFWKTTANDLQCKKCTILAFVILQVVILELRCSRLFSPADCQDPCK